MSLSGLLPILFAPAAGSFLGVVIARIPAHRPIGLARSRCDACGRALSWPDLVPLASWLALRGRCRSCRVWIGLFPFAIEAAASGVALWTATETGGDAGRRWAGCVFGWGLLALGWIDIRHMILPDVITLPLLLAGLAATALTDPAALGDHALGALAGYAGLAAVALIYRALRHRDGLGGGDAKLLAAAGAWLGWQALPHLVLGAALLGLGLAATLALAGRRVDRTTRLPFGPPLALASWLTWLYGPF